jgi:hypothetical protein
VAALLALALAAGCARDRGAPAARLADPGDPAAISLRLVDPVRFAVIGDYGTGDAPETDVARLVRTWRPQFIATTGDNNYPAGAAETIDDRIGKAWSEFIAPYRGSFGPGAAANAFFPVLGNHDWETPGALPYLDYFGLPGNERYYDVAKGVVHLFAVDSDPREPDGVDAGSAQARWLCDRLRASTARWKLVFLHHPPWSSGRHGSSEWTQWGFAACGAHAVFAGHDHLYERIARDGVVYFVNGAGGAGLYGFQSRPVEGSRARFNADFGAQLVEADARTLLVRFFSRTGELVDWVALGEAAGEPR